MAENRDYIAIYRQYRDDARKAKNNKKYCKWVRLAAQREFKDRQRAERDKSWPYYFSEWHATDVCDFVEKLPHKEGTWDNPTLILEPWQVFILVVVFGWRKRVGVENSDNDPRRFNTAYIELARKNGKSFLSSAVALYGLCCEGEPGPQVKTAATTGDQARIVFDASKAIVEKTPALRDAFSLNPMANSIVCGVNGGHIKPINAKASTQDGLNPHWSIIDELHAHDSRKLFDVLKTARGARKNPMSWYITTAGYNLEGVCYEQRTYVCKLLENIIDGDHYFGIIYTLDEKDDPFDSNVWIKPNPNLRVSVDYDELKTFAEEAQNSPKSEGDFKTKRLNLWLNAASTWLNMYQWDACRSGDVKIEDFWGQTAFLGCDLADKNDMAAVVVVFYTKEMVTVFPFFYLPRDLVNYYAPHRPHYRVWADSGLLKLTPGDYIDHKYIREDIIRLCRQFVVPEVGFDQFGSHEMVSRLMDEGIEAVLVHKNAKNYTDPAKDLEARIQAKMFRHDGNPVLRWMASNVVIDQRVDGSLLPKKENKDSPNKIDGIDALLLAMGRAIINFEPESVYEERGLLLI